MEINSKSWICNTCMAYLGEYVDEDTWCDCDGMDNCEDWWRIDDLEKDMYYQELGYPLEIGERMTGSEQLATFILFTAESYEAMWNSEAYKLERESIHRQMTPKEIRMFPLIVDPNRFCTWSLNQAAEHTVRFYLQIANERESEELLKRIARPISIMLRSWSEAIDWATEIMKDFWEERTR